MAFRDSYERQVRLLLRVLPAVGEETNLALKGGTAINLFVRDMPRLSVDTPSDLCAKRSKARSPSGHDDLGRPIRAPC